MPIYEFTCCDCDAEFESFVKKASDAATVQCPACNRSYSFTAQGAIQTD
jgi:putative FmdB family regulatory protein